MSLVRDVHTRSLCGCGVESASQSQIWWLCSGTIWLWNEITVDGHQTIKARI
jgi:hypothetical protein